MTANTKASMPGFADRVSIEASNFSQNNNAFSATSQVMSAESIYSILGGKPKSGGGYLCHCPAHEDKSPSLSVDDGDNGRPLVKCWSGCPQEAVVDALKERGAWPDGSRTAPRRAPVKRSVDQWQPTRTDTPPGSISHPSLGKPSATWSYRDQDGHVLTIDCRFDPKDGKKQVLPYTPGTNTATGKREWKWKSLPAPRPLYGLDRLAQRPDAPVLFCEGCKAADAGQRLLPAVVVVSWPGGCGAVDKADLAPIAGRRVAIWPDNDEPGRKAAKTLAQRCLEAGAGEVYIIEIPPGKKEGWDLADAEAEGWTPEQVSEWLKGNKRLVERERKSTEIKPEIPDLQIKQKMATVCSSLYDFLSLEIPLREPLLSPWLVKQSITMLYAWRGLGKSWLAMSIGYAVATGSPLLNWNAPSRGKVLYIDGELPAKTLQDRMALIVNSFDNEPLDDGFQILTPDLQTDGIMPNLSTIDGQAAIDEHANKADLIIVDNLSCLARSGKENEGESWLPIQAWALRHRAQGRSILFVHHSGKNGQQRGASRREDVLDVVMVLKRPEGYQADEGARFDLLFEKSRNLTGEDVTPLSVALQSDKTKITWKWSPAENAIVDRISELIKDGATRRDIQDETGLSRFALKRLVDQANSTRPHPEKITLPDARKGGAQ